MLSVTQYVCIVDYYVTHSQCFHESYSSGSSESAKQPSPTVASFLWRVEHIPSEHYCQAEVFCSCYTQNCGAIAVIASTTYMTILEIFDECLTPSSPEIMIIIGHDTNIYIERYNLNRKKHQSLLLRGIGSGSGPSSPPPSFLSWHGD